MKKENWVRDRIMYCAEGLAVGHSRWGEAQNDSYASSMVTRKMKTLLPGLQSQ